MGRADFSSLSSLLIPNSCRMPPSTIWMGREAAPSEEANNLFEIDRGERMSLYRGSIHWNEYFMELGDLTELEEVGSRRVHKSGE